MCLKREIWIGKVLPALIFIALWMDGWFYPLLLLPILYVLLVEKKSLGWLGFGKAWFSLSVSAGAVIAAGLSLLYLGTFLHHLPVFERQPPMPLAVFTDVLWYPLYEETAYRSFFLAHFGNPGAPGISRRNLLANLSQSLLFLSIHRHHLVAGMPLVLVPVFMLGLLNGFLFLRTRNLYGCLLSHSALNGFAFLIQHALY